MSANPNGNVQMWYVRQSDGLAYCFSPVPLIAQSRQNISKIKGGVETQFAVQHSYTFAGTLLPEKPALSGVNDNATCIELLDRKSDQLESALSEDRGNLLIVDGSGYPILSIYPKVTSIDFPESQIVQKRDYSVVFEYDEYLDDGCKIKDFDETWDFSYQDDDTIGVSHNVSAVGISELPAGTGAVENAKAFVLNYANTLDRTQYAFLSSPYVPSIVDADVLSEYNHVRTENIGVAEGTYSISETWVMSSGTYKDDRTIDLSYELDEYGSLIETKSVNGTVQGYGDTTISKYNAAVAGFENYVAPEIGFNASAGLATKSRSDNRFAGAVNYSITYDTIGDNALENRSISRSFQRNDDGTVSQTVTTSAGVRLSSASGISAAVNFCFENNYPIDSPIEPFFDASLSGNLESVSYQRDELTKSFSLTRTFREQGTALYREEWQVSRDQSLETATTTITVNGTIQGLAVESGTNSIVRFNAASGAYYNVISNLIRDRALEIIPSGSCIGDNPIQSTLGFNKLNGTITYSQRFDNRYLTSNPNIYDEKIDVSYTLPAQVVATIPIPGKASGPILQDQETYTGSSKALKIQYTMKPSGIDCGETSVLSQSLLEAEALAESNILVNNTYLDNSRGEKPISTSVYRTADNYTFNRQTLVFTRNVTWTYSNS